FDYLMRERDKRSTKDIHTLQTKTFYGNEKKRLAYVLGVMNMTLHGIEAPNIVQTNSPEGNLSDIQDKDRFDIVLANPPFGGKERKQIQHNFPIRTGETAFLFLQHFIKSLKAGDRDSGLLKYVQNLRAKCRDMKYLFNAIEPGCAPDTAEVHP